MGDDIQALRVETRGFEREWGNEKGGESRKQREVRSIPLQNKLVKTKNRSYVCSIVDLFVVRICFVFPSPGIESNTAYFIYLFCAPRRNAVLVHPDNFHPHPEQPRKM